MTKPMTLDEIREAAEAQYGCLPIELPSTTAKLLNPLRMKKDNRTRLVVLQDEMNAEDADQEALLREALTVICETPSQARALLKEVGEDLAAMAVIFQRYAKGAQAGEASA